MAGKRYSAERRQELLTLLSKRTESISSFARAHGVSAATLYKWQRPKSGAEGSFVEIRRQDGRAPAEPGLLMQVGQMYLSFEVLPDVEWLAGLVQKLQG